MAEIIEKVQYCDVVEREHQILSKAVSDALDELSNGFYGVPVHSSYCTAKNELGDFYTLSTSDNEAIVKVEVKRDTENVTDHAVVAKVTGGLGLKESDLVTNHLTLENMFDGFEIKKGFFGTTFTYKKFDNTNSYIYQVLEVCIRYSIMAQFKAHYPEIASVTMVNTVDNPVLRMVLKNDLRKPINEFANNTEFDLKNEVAIPVDCELDTFIPEAIEKHQEAYEVLTKAYEKSQANVGYKISLHTAEYYAGAVILYAHRSERPIVDNNLWIHYICPETGSSVMEDVKKYRRVEILEI